MFPPGSAISLLPAHASTGGESGPEISDSHLRFGCRTLVPSAVSQDHAYPPSRSSLSSQSPTPIVLAQGPLSSIEPMNTPMSTGVTTQEDPPVASPSNRRSLPTSTIRSLPLPAEWQITHYILKNGEPEAGQFAHLHHHHHLRSQPSHPPHTSLLHRALAPVTRLANSSSNHFYLVPESASNAPLIVFTDSTPVLSAIPSGTLTVDEQEIRSLGVEMAFWVAISLAYLDYLRDRDVSSPPLLVESILCSTCPELSSRQRLIETRLMCHQTPICKCRFLYV